MEKSDMPKVSVIIPFYSHKEWLEESLNSVFTQTFQDFEVIIINDGSKEDISDILNKFEGKVIYLEQENKGPGAARNLGIRHANGKYIAFEDSDDIWLPEKLKMQVSFMEERDLVWSHTGFYYWWPDNDRLKNIKVDREYGDIHFQRYVTVKMATPCVMINKEYVFKDDFFFPEQYRNGEDGNLWNKIASKYPVGLIQTPLAKIRMRGTNSNTHAIERFRLEAEVYNRLKNNHADCPAGVIRIKHIYSFYSSFFKGEITPFKDFVAKCLWVLPYSIERVYVKYLAKISDKSEKYIIRC